MPRPSLVSLDRDCIPVVDSYRAKLQKKAEKVLSTTIPAELAKLDEVLKNVMMEPDFTEEVRDFTEETVSSYELMLDEIAEANQGKQMQLEAALGLLLGGMKPQAPANNEEDETGAEETDAELPAADKQTESNMSVESVDSSSPSEKVTIGKKRRRGSIKKTEGLKLENKDSNLSLDIKVSNISEGSSKAEEKELQTPTIGINEPLHKLSTLLKPLILNLYDTVILLRNWITLMIPKIEDGNTFGVEVQENMLVQLRQCEIYMLMLIEEKGAYHLERATMISKLASNGEIRDYMQYIYEADERHCRKLQDGARLIRSQYNVLYRSITQNYDKITRPRGHANKNNMLIY